MSTVTRWSREARRQRRLRRQQEAKPPLNITVRVTIERIQDGQIVLSKATGIGANLLEAIIAARGRTKTMFRELSELIVQIPPTEDEGSKEATP